MKQCETFYEADIILRAPLPNIDVEEQQLATVKQCWNRDGLNIKFLAEDEYPISFSWAEIVIAGTTFVGLGILSHYLDKILDAFDVFVKAKITELNLHIVWKGKATYRNIPLRNRSASRKILADALAELDMLASDKEAKVYRLQNAEICDDGTIHVWSVHQGGRSETRLEIKPDDKRYRFWDWLVNKQCVAEPISESQLEQFHNKYLND